MNKLGLGTNNFRIIGSAPPPPEFTRYIIADCVVDGNQYYTTYYGYNDFQINDRVIYNTGARDSFGKVIARTTEEGDEINPSFVGVNSPNCYDNILNFNSNCFGDEKIKIGFSCNPLLGNFNYDARLDTFISYNYYFNVYYEATDNEGNDYDDYDGMSEISGTYEFGEYNFIQNQNNFMFEVQQERDGIVTYATIDSGYEQPYFGATINLSDNNNCSYNYFLQPSTGYSFNALFRNDNC